MSTPTPEAVDRFVGDEHWGKGGSYVVIDGKRVPAPIDDVPPAAPAEPAPADQPSVKKGK